MGSRLQYSKLRQSPRDWRIIRWLRRAPVPVKLVGETEDGEQLTVAVSDEGTHRFADATAAIRRCSQIQAYDAKGNVLRSLELDPNDPELQAADELELSHKQASSGRAEIISIDVPKLVDNIAGNMKEVASAAATQQANAFREGFGAMVQVVQLCLQLLVRTEQRLDEVQSQIVETPETTTPGREQLAMLALQQVMNGQGAKPNGSSGLDPSKLAELATLLQTLQGGASSDDAGQ